MSPSSGDLSNDLFTRYRGNPLLTPNRWPYTVNAVMNAGAAEVDGTTVLLCRVEDRRGLSHLTVARSRNGFSNWVVDEKPLLEADPSLDYEVWGVEDPRLGRCPDTPHRLRGAVRAVRGRGDGRRHPGHRLLAGVHA